MDYKTCKTYTHKNLSVMFPKSVQITWQNKRQQPAHMLFILLATTVSPNREKGQLYNLHKETNLGNTPEFEIFPADSALGECETVVHSRRGIQQ